MRGLYIHIPFCHQICHYCDFNKVFFHAQPVDEYIQSVLMELTTYKNETDFTQLETIFIGGGTPTALSAEQLTTLLEGIAERIDCTNLREYTIEANPDELTEEKMQVCLKYGITRLSLGVQSFSNDLLKAIGRTHSKEQVIEVVELAKKMAFQSISLDLMYALPNQTMEDWQATVQQALALQVDHYSAYSLIVEPKTVFYNRRVKGQLPLPSEDVEADMFRYVMNEMKRVGYEQYEISNFARQGEQSVHNLIYWENDEYIGIGAGAHGYRAGVRYSNAGPLKKYMTAVAKYGHSRVSEHIVTPIEAMEEQLFLGLRTKAGVSKRDFFKRFGCELETVYGEELTQLVNTGLLIEVSGSYTLSKLGIFRGNIVFEQFLRS